MRRGDGSIESSNLPARYKLLDDQEYGMVKAMITRVYYTDEQNNVSKGARNKEVIYEAIVIGGPREGQIITNIRDSLSLGGEYNYSEKIWRATSKKSFVQGQGTPFEEQDGDLVYISFLGGNPNFPIIIGGAKHFLNESKSGATKSEAPRLLFEYNGINVLINNKGELLVTRKGGEVNDEKAAFIPENEEAANIQMLDKKVIIKDAEGNEITIDAESKKITITAPENFEVNTKVMKLLADNSFTLESQTITISGETVIVDGTQVLLGGGGPGVTRIGDTAIGTGAHGVTVVSTIITGSFTVKAS